MAFDTKESGRRELAEAIVSPDNPLTYRVYANRLWSMFFGEGLVPTTSNFGSLGEPPSHPDLLDDLAHRLRSNGGSPKRWCAKWSSRRPIAKPLRSPMTTSTKIRPTDGFPA